MKTIKRKILPCILLLGLIMIFASGCMLKERSAVKKAVKNDLNQMKNSEISELFYKDLSFKVKKITIDKDEAVVKGQMKNLDTKALAKDFSRCVLQKQIKNSVNPDENAVFTEDDSYPLLKNLLETKTYEKTSSDADIRLKKTGHSWQVLHTPELDSLLTGDFLLHTSDPYLLSPSEIVDIHFDAIHNFSPAELERYLSLNHISDRNDSFCSHIAASLSEQIFRFFDYKILDETADETSAVVQVSVTSVDFHRIADDYEEKLAQWSKTSEALSLGSDKRLEKEQQLLLTSIEANEESTSETLDIHLFNDGINWKIQMDSEIAHAVFGNVKEAMDSITQSVK